MTTTLPSQRSPLRSPPASSESSDMSSLSSLFALLAIIVIPTLIYAFFFAIKCPNCNPFRRNHRSSGEIAGDLTGRSMTRNMELISGSVVKYEKEAHGKEYGGECPVCLSAFADGEELRLLKACNHSFHVACIDQWLNTHFNCPVCRASISVSRPKSSAMHGDDDFQQGLPDSANLV